MVSDFLGALGKRSGQPLSALTPRDIEAFRGWCASSRGCSPVTVSQDLKIVRSILEQARKQGIIVSNPAASVESPRGEGLDRDVFTPEEVGVLCGAADAEWRTAILFGYFAGMRLSDAVSRSWREIDLAAEVIDYVQGEDGSTSCCAASSEPGRSFDGKPGMIPRGCSLPGLAVRREIDRAMCRSCLLA